MSPHQPPTPSYEPSIELDSLIDPSDGLEDAERDQDPLTADLSEQLDVEHCTSASTPPLLTEEDQKVSGGLKTTRKYATEWWVEWRLEVLSGMLSIVALVATVVTLEPNQGKPLPQWPFDISINALLSIYSVVFKICIIFVVQSCISQQQWVWFESERQLYDATLFDSARQGPYGSAVWIWVHRLRQPLTTLGAVILILSVAVDPFYQQLLHYADCETPLQEAATAARSNYFDAGLHLLVIAHVDAQSALRSGVFSRPDIMQPQCSSGNCTFTTYSTVGYCNECQDISEDLNFTAIPVEQDQYDCAAYEGSEDFVITSYLPSNFSMIWNTSKHSPAVLSSTLSQRPPLEFEIIMGKTTFSDLRLDPTTGANLTRCDSQLDFDDDWGCRGYGAARCSLFPCVRTYNTTVKAGIVTENLIEHTTLETLRDRPFWDPTSDHYGISENGILVLINTSCISPEDEQQLSRLGYQTNSKWLVYNMSYDFNLEILYPPDAAFPGSMIARSCTYALDDSTANYGLVDFFASSGFLQGAAAGYTHSIIHSYVDGSPGCDWGIMASFSGPSELQVLYNSSNVSFQGIQETFDNMATSFTNYMRINGHENYSAPAQGIVWHYATCLEVRWYWIMLPATLVTITMLCLLPMTVHATLRADVPTWKIGLLPLVFRGPLVHQEQQRQSGDEDEGFATVSTGNSVQDMEEKSKGMRVRLTGVGHETRQLKIT